MITKTMGRRLHLSSTADSTTSKSLLSSNERTMLDIFPLLSHSSRIRSRLVPSLLILVLMATCSKTVYGLSCGDEEGPTMENPKDGACGDINIRNSVRNFARLENCTVIEGSLHISLLDYVPQSVYDEYSFPKLREITGNLMMFRVFGLKTLRNLFPNLAVIRGQNLFFNDYALVAFEMRDMEELGLVNLTTIIKGAVRLTKNQKLCHVNSIDWGKLAIGVDPSKHQFIDNREDQMCPDVCSDDCARTTFNGVARKRCWTSEEGACQKLLSKLQGPKPSDETSLCMF